MREVAIAIVAAGALVAAAIYLRPQPRYDVQAASYGIVRTDRMRGGILVCSAAQCAAMPVYGTDEYGDPKPNPDSPAYSNELGDPVKSGPNK